MWSTYGKAREECMGSGGRSTCQQYVYNNGTQDPFFSCSHPITTLDPSERHFRGNIIKFGLGWLRDGWEGGWEERANGP